MTREEAKKAAEVMMAYANGKEIEFNNSSVENNHHWEEATDPVFDWYHRKYRVKSKPKYRPFKTKEECWEEMLKHQPFGWVKYKETGTYIMISTIYSTTTDHLLHVTNPQEVSIDCCEYSFSGKFDKFCFADDTPLGIKKE